MRELRTHMRVAAGAVRHLVEAWWRGWLRRNRARGRWGAWGQAVWHVAGAVEVTACRLAAVASAMAVYIQTVSRIACYQRHATYSSIWATHLQLHAMAQLARPRHSRST